MIRGEGEARSETRATAIQFKPNWPGLAATLTVVGVCGLISSMIRAWQLSEANIVMVFLLGVALVSARFGRGLAVFAAIASVVVFDFFFVPPYYKITVDDSQYLLTFGVMLVIGASSAKPQDGSIGKDVNTCDDVPAQIWEPAFERTKTSRHLR